MSKYSGVRIEYHILQSFPVTCLNRDDVGAPKTAIVGGVERGRVSSQCWKRQVRLAMAKDPDAKFAIRTKNIEKLIKDQFTGDVTEEKERLIELISKTLSKDTLFFMSRQEAEALADYIEHSSSAIERIKDKKLVSEIKKVMNSALRKGFSDKMNGLDIALFGRMVANVADLNVEAACSFSHAITTHKIVSSSDYFTAVDEYQKEEDNAGAAHMGVTEYSSGTYYRYISLDLGLLEETLGDETDIPKAVEIFTKALYVAVPAARQATMTGLCPWDYAHIFVRKGQGIQLSFDKPVKSTGNGYLEPSIKTMEEGLDRNKKLAGSLWGEIAEFVYGADLDFSIDRLLTDLCAVVASYGKGEE